MISEESEFQERLLKQARPNPTLSPHAVEIALRSAEVASQKPRKRSTTLVIGLSVFGAITIVPTAAFALQAFDAQTGIFNSPVGGSASSDFNSPDREEIVDQLELGTESTPGNEWIDVRAGDIESYVASVTPRDLPIPAAVTWDQIITVVTQNTVQNAAALGASVRSEEIVIQLSFEHAIRGAWITEWFDAYQDSDEERIKAAASALENAVEWPATLTSLDGVPHEPTRNWMKVLALGDYEAAQAYAQMDLSDEWDGIDRSDLMSQLNDGTYVGKGVDFP